MARCRSSGSNRRPGRPRGSCLRPCAFRPTFHKHAGLACFGVQAHLTDPRRFAPAFFTTAMLSLARAQDPDRFAWRTEPYEFVDLPIAIDLLYGSPRERLLIESGPTPDDLLDLRALWSRDEQDFRTRREPFLLPDQ